MRFYKLTASLVLLLAGLAQAEVPREDPREFTEDGLLRAPSSRKVGVYRAPGVSFITYKHVELAPVEVKFRKSWERNARRSDHISEKDLQKIKDDMASMLKEELRKELVERHGYGLSVHSSSDTLRVRASILNLVVAAPEAGQEHRVETWVRSTGSMKIEVELYDAATDKIVGRIIDYYEVPESLDPKLVTKISTDEDFRRGFIEMARYTREALDVAKAERQLEQPP